MNHLMMMKLLNPILLITRNPKNNQTKLNLHQTKEKVLQKLLRDNLQKTLPLTISETSSISPKLHPYLHTKPKTLNKQINHLHTNLTPNMWMKILFWKDQVLTCSTRTKTPLQLMSNQRTCSLSFLSHSKKKTYPPNNRTFLLQRRTSLLCELC